MSIEKTNVAFQIMGPDGIALTSMPFRTRQQAEAYIAEWCARYTSQGYYSSPDGRIELVDLPGMCVVEEAEVQPEPLIEDSRQTCCQCGLSARFFQTNTGWEELRVYKLAAYPDELMVMTSATPEQFREALDNWEAGEFNIEQVLHNFGFVAMACREPETIQEFIL